MTQQADATHPSVPAADAPHCRDCEGQAVSLIIQGRARPVGTFIVSRLLPSPKRRSVGPFVFLDRMGPVDVAPGTGFDVLPHPHIGLSTVTYLLDGENVHRDSLGTVQKNCARDLNLMTAGRGVVHSERADPEWRDRGGRFDGIQLWVGLPTANEEDAPSFVHAPASSLPCVEPAPGVSARVLLGAALGVASPVAHPSTPLLVELELAEGSTLDLPGESEERAILVISGAVTVDGHELGADHLAILSTAAPLCITAKAASRLMLLGGPPLDGPRFIDWNFVSSSPERIEAARRGWKERTFPSIPGDDQEFVPLPEQPRTPYRLGRI